MHKRETIGADGSGAAALTLALTLAQTPTQHHNWRLCCHAMDCYL